MNKAVIGYVHPDFVRAEFLASMLGLCRRGRTTVDAIKHVHSGPNIARARNALVRAFLEESRAAWLLTIDTDMVFAPDTLDRLVAAADPETRPVMGALCHMQEELGGDPLPTLYELVGEGGAAAFARYQVWPEDQPMRVAATGTGCLLVHRRVFETVAAGHDGKCDEVWPWFRESTLGVRPLGEDFTFMLRCGVAGIPIHVHTGVQVGHMKSTMLGKVR